MRALPAAETTTTPRSVTESIASCSEAGQYSNRPMDRLMMSAGLSFQISLPSVPSAGMRPAAQRMASLMSDRRPPHLPRARTGTIFTFQAPPATPAPLFDAAAPIVPATCVPWKESAAPGTEALHRSPGSFGSESRPSPSLPMRGSETMSQPGAMFGESLMSGWFICRPVSTTATTTSREPSMP